jgi:cation:H+ antiporter
MDYLLFVAGFFLVIYGANFLVDGAASIAKKFKISNLVIGLTVVAFGTSAPELVVTVLASVSGNNDIAFGNVVGSNILNVLLILGVAAVIFPLTVHKNTVWKEIPLALLAAILIFVLGSDFLFENERIDYLAALTPPAVPFVGALTRIDGLVLLSFFMVFLFYAFASAKEGAESPVSVSDDDIKDLPPAKSILYLLLGLAGLTVGGKWIVTGAIELSTLMGLSEKFVGLTIVSLGTSLPELATTIVAARKHQSDIAIGNVVGSNIFNTFLILGVGAVVNPIAVNTFGQIDTLVNIATSILLFALLFVGKRHTIGRFEGIIFLLAYVAYTFYLFYRE